MARTVPIRRSLIANLTAVVVFLGLSILILVFFGGRRALRGFSQSLIDQALKRTEAQLAGFFDPVARQLEILGGWTQSGVLQGETDATTTLLRSILIEYPAVTSVMLADDRGREHMLMQQDDRWRVRLVNKDERGDLARWTDWTDDPATATFSDEMTEYDPRVRPWYTAAIGSLGEGNGSSWKRGAVQWTEPYTFFTTKEPGITASIALRSPDARIHVIGLDVKLIDISRFTTSIEIRETGAVFVLTEDDRLVGLPRAPQFEDETAFLNAILKRPDELGSEAAMAVSRSLLAGDARGKSTRFEAEGQAWWGQVESFHLGPDRPFTIGVLVAEADLIGDLQKQRLWIGLMTLGFVGLAVWRAFHLGSRYSRPVEALVQESGRIAEGDLEAGEPIETRVEEVRRLAEAHDKMRAGLKTLLKIERDLQIARRIQNSTFPERLPTLAGFDLAAWSEPADETGGDTYDVVGMQSASLSDTIVLTEQDAGRAVLLLADATGHGIGPALSVTQVRAMLRMGVRMSRDLSGIASQINEQLCADLPTGRFITAWLGEVNSDDGSVSAVSAGQAPILRYDAAMDDFDVLNADSQPLGLFDHARVPPPKRWVMKEGDIFAVISDGIFEAKGPAGEDFGTDRTLAVIREKRAATSSEILDAIREAVEVYTQGAPADDDRTMIVIKRVRGHAAGGGAGS